MLRSFLKLAAALLLVLGFAAPARADVFLAGEFSLMAGEEPNSYEFRAQVPELVAARTAITLPDGCRQTGSSRQSMSGRAQLLYEFSCERPIARGDVIETPWRIDGARFTTSLLGQPVTRSLPGSDTGVSVPVGDASSRDRPWTEIAPEFVWQGMIHIWMGWDHLAFVLCLCLLVRGRALIWLITAFTLGHSISLAGAFFEVIRIPVPPVEAIIALSIAFMAREALLAREPMPMATLLPRHMVVVSLFGLLHGLGFASALGELGVAQAERLPALLFFNIGVEVGQLVFVAAMAVLMAGLRAIALATPARAMALYGVGVLGCFWAFERVTGFLTGA
jgi:hypothetical protein